MGAFVIGGGECVMTASDSGIIEAAIEKLGRNLAKASTGTTASSSSPISAFIALAPELINQLALSAEVYGEGGAVACDHCWANLRIAKDLLGIEQTDD